MNVLFMTIGKMDDIEEHTIYCDLLRYFRDAGHSVYTISPYEKRTGLQTRRNNFVCCAIVVFLFQLRTFQYSYLKFLERVLDMINGLTCSAFKLSPSPYNWK